MTVHLRSMSPAQWKIRPSGGSFTRSTALITLSYVVGPTPGGKFVVLIATAIGSLPSAWLPRRAHRMPARREVRHSEEWMAAPAGVDRPRAARAPCRRAPPARASVALAGRRAQALGDGNGDPDAAVACRAVLAARALLVVVGVRAEAAEP